MHRISGDGKLVHGAESVRRYIFDFVHALCLVPSVYVFFVLAVSDSSAVALNSHLRIKNTYTSFDEIFSPHNCNEYDYSKTNIYHLNFV